MNRVNGLRPLILLFLSLLALALPSVVRADEGDPAPPSLQARARQLAADVREFAREPGLSHAKREKRIATAVRVAVDAATAYRSEPDAVVDAAALLAAAATRAAPAYAEVIQKAATFAPAVARVSGASARVRSASLAAAAGGPERFATRRRSAAPRPPVETAEAPEAEPAPAGDEAAPAPRRHRAAPADEAAAEGVAAADESEAPTRRVALDQAARLSVSTTLGVRHDDNVYLGNTNKVSDTIISAAPGIDLHWGQDAQTHGSLAYQEDFEHYTGGSAPNVALGTGKADFGYDDGRTNVALNAAYNQTYQARVDLIGSGLSTLVRTNAFDAGGMFATDLGAKTGVRIGAAYTDTAYRSAGLLGNTYLSFPASLYYRVTPKTDLSLGYTYGLQRPEGGGPNAKDQYLNLGANGSFTAKLSGNLSVGYQSRKVAAFAADRILAFNGGLNYELTPKTSATLSFSRNFNASALGATTTNSSYRLGLNAEVSPQWHLGADLGLLDNGYGAGVFRTDTGFALTERTDRTWVADLSATYLYSEWLSTSASYQLRHNSSTLSTVDFSDNVLNLSIGLRY